MDDGKDVAGNPKAPAPSVPDRLFRQTRSTSGKLAYVIFGATEDCGVYNNWCVQCLILINTASDSFFQASSQTLSFNVPPLSKAKQ
jgi:hypothetical protein